MNKVKIGNYGKYSSSNYGSCRYVEIGNLTLYFSYETVIAFNDGRGLIASENCWKQTTGKHLNWLEPEKFKRYPREEFEKELEKVLTSHGLSV